MTADPTDTEILAAVERWARARGYWYSGDCEPPSTGWYVQPWFDDGFWVCNRSLNKTWPVEPTTALVWALLVESGLTVDVGRCPACEGDGVQHYAAVDHGAPWPESQRRAWLTRGGPQWCSHRACPECPPREKNTKPAAKRGVRAGTGRDVREAARVLLDATPQEAARRRDPLIHEVPTVWREGSRSVARQDHDDGSSVWIRLGDPAAREALAILADRLEHAGSPLGPLLSAWLRESEVKRLEGWRRGALDVLVAIWESITVPCGACEGLGRLDGQRGDRLAGTLHGARASAAGDDPRTCPNCEGHGRVRHG